MSTSPPDHMYNADPKINEIVAARYAAALARYNKRVKEYNRAMALRAKELEVCKDLAAIREKEAKANS